MNVPNALTLLRMLMVPGFALLFKRAQYPWALIVFLLASATDYLDGYLARRLNQITAFGKLMDPLADKLMLLTALFLLAGGQYMPWWVFYVLAIKEGLMVLGTVLMLKRQVVVSANLYGKIATVAFIVAVFAVFPWHGWTWLTAFGQIVMYVALLLSIMAMLIYARNALRVKNDINADISGN